MLQRAFPYIAVSILIIVVGLTAVLLNAQARHGRTIEAENRAVEILNTTTEASQALDRQRIGLAASSYLPLDQENFRSLTEDFQQALRTLLPGATAEERAQITLIRDYQLRFSHQVLALPTAPTPTQVHVVMNQAEAVSDLLDHFRITHRVDLLALFTTEREQRALNTTALLLANGAVLLFLLVGIFTLTRIGRLQAEASSLRASEQLRSEFVSFAAHELRNPASAIKTGAMMLTEPELEPEIRMQVVSSINRSADALSRVVLNLLNIGRIEAGELRLKRQPISIAALADELISELALYHTGLETRIQRHLPDVAVDVDAEYVKLALSNILDNAIKYSSASTFVYLTAETGPKMLVVHVRDTGTGIPPEQLSHIFDKYETSGEAPHSTRRGVGLGLYMTRLLIEAHGGGVWAESTLGKGTTISFSLPRADVPNHERGIADR